METLIWHYLVWLIQNIIQGLCYSSARVDYTHCWCVTWPLIKIWICGLITILHIVFITLNGNNTIYCDRLIMLRCTQCPHLGTAVMAVYVIFSALILFTDGCFRPSNQVVRGLYLNLDVKLAVMEHKKLLWILYVDFMCYSVSVHLHYWK